MTVSDSLYIRTHGNWYGQHPKNRPPKFKKFSRRKPRCPHLRHSQRPNRLASGVVAFPYNLARTSPHCRVTPKKGGPRQKLDIESSKPASSQLTRKVVWFKGLRSCSGVGKHTRTRHARIHAQGPAKRQLQAKSLPRQESPRSIQPTQYYTSSKHTTRVLGFRIWKFPDEV